MSTTQASKQAGAIYKASDLNIGDVVNLQPNCTNDAFNDLIVVERNDKENWIKFYRVFVSLADFTYTGGVLHYIGHEEFAVNFSSPCQYIFRKNIFTPGHLEEMSTKTQANIK